MKVLSQRNGSGGGVEMPSPLRFYAHKTSGLQRPISWPTRGLPSSARSSSRVISAEESERRDTRMETANQRKCHNCGQTGHLRRDCPEASTQEGGFGGYSGAACFGCGKVGHLKRDCPTAAGGRACHNCGQVGHIRRDCPEDVQPPKCHNCGESGHLRRDCPQELRESRKCHHCGQTGHLRRDCPDDSGPSEDKCYQCGETGHWARNCPGAKD